MLFEEEFRQWALGLLLEDFTQRPSVPFGDERRVQVVALLLVVLVGIWVSMGGPGPAWGCGSRPEGWLASGEPFRKGGARGSLPNRRRMGGWAVPRPEHAYNLARFYAAAYY